jgi:hypothetical protein
MFEGLQSRLTKDGLENIRSIKEGMNQGRKFQ